MRSDPESRSGIGEGDDQRPECFYELAVVVAGMYVAISWPCYQLISPCLCEGLSG